MEVEDIQTRTTYHEDRPWGSFDQFAHNEACTVKLLTIQRGQSLSLQKHHRRSEFWRIISGTGSVQIGDTITPCHAGDEFQIPVETQHRAIADTESLLVLELSFGDFDENDNERLEDRYGRVKN